MDNPHFHLSPELWHDKIGSMTRAEEAIYLELLIACWQTSSCSLPNDPVQLAKLISVSVISQTVVKCFTPHPELPAQLTSVGLLTEWKKAKLRSDGHRRGGLLTAAKRAAKKAANRPVSKHEVGEPSLAKLVAKLTSSNSLSANDPIAKLIAKLEIYPPRRRGGILPGPPSEEAAGQYIHTKTRGGRDGNWDLAVRDRTDQERLDRKAEEAAVLKKRAVVTTMLEKLPENERGRLRAQALQAMPASIRAAIPKDADVIQHPVLRSFAASLLGKEPVNKHGTFEFETG